MRAFISHSSKNVEIAIALEAALEQRDVPVWLDSSHLHFGGLLRRELIAAIEQSTVLVLLWSEHAATSRWVAAEMLTAYHLGRFIIPCRLDHTPLPQFLASAVFPVMGGSPAAAVLDRLARSIREAPSAANALLPRMRSQPPELKEAVRTLALLQREELELLIARDLVKAGELHAQGGELLERVLPLFGLDTDVLNLAGYHHKNAYMLAHWDAIQAGRPPVDSVLERAERYFFETLFVDPHDCSGLDGLGSVLLLERELEAAEFFLERAVEEARAAGIDYAEAKQNLELVRSYLGRSPGSRSTTPSPAVRVATVTTPADALAHGHDAYVREDFATSVAYYDRALELQPDWPEALTFRGLARLRVTRTEAGMQDLERAAQLAPGQPQILTARGAALVGLGRVDEGLADLDRALELDPADPQIMYNKACAHALRGETAPAREWLDRAIARDARYGTAAVSDPHLQSLRQPPHT